MQGADHFRLWLAMVWLMAGNSGQVLQAQAFQEIQIRDIAKMSNNWGNAVADYDQDGDLDIFIVAYEPFQANQATSWSRLLQNRGGNWFEDVTVKAGFAQQYDTGSNRDFKIGASWGDYNNDGYPDLFLTHEGHTELYRNDQDGSFTEVTFTANISSCAGCVNTSALWWDYDRDGDLDMYVSNYIGPNRLFTNQGDGSFLDTSQALQLDDDGSTWYSIPIDADRDGWPDLYVINDYGFSRFYHNLQGQSFEEATTAFGLQNSGNGMGATIGDYNRDGYFDIYVTNIAELQPNALLTGSRDGYFQDQNQLQGVGNGHWGWGTRFFDADHDGDEDLYLVNGFGNLNYPNKFFKNLSMEGFPFFEDWSINAKTDGLAQGMGLEVFDYDQDGDLDLLVSNMNGAPYLYNNIGRAPGSNWLQVDLEGHQSNRDAFGAIVKIYAEDQFWQRYYHGSSIMSQSIQAVHFGLGPIHQIDSLVVIWPNSEPEVFFDIAANQKISIAEHRSLTLTPVSENGGSVFSKESLFLEKLYPNPFGSVISFDLVAPRGGDLKVEVSNLYGQRVWNTAWKIPQAGAFSVSWNGRGRNQTRLPPGAYLYTLHFEETNLSGKIILR